MTCARIYSVRQSFIIFMCNGPIVDLDGLMGYEDGVVECDQLGVLG